MLDLLVILGILIVAFCLYKSLKGGGNMSARRGNAEYVLLNEENGTFETFDSEEDLQEFLEEEGFDTDETKELRVLSVDTEYRVNVKSYELEEV